MRIAVASALIIGLLITMVGVASAGHHRPVKCDDYHDRGKRECVVPNGAEATPTPVVDEDTPPPPMVDEPYPPSTNPDTGESDTGRQEWDVTEGCDDPYVEAILKMLGHCNT